MNYEGMTEQEKYARALEAVKEYGQGHLLAFYGGLNGAQRRELLDGILSTDFALLRKLHRLAGEEPAAAGEIAPAAVTDRDSLSPARRAEARSLGMEAMAAGQYAVVTMAGGEGSRLGHSGPKGTFSLRLERDKTLFEAQLDRIRAMSRRAGAPIPWYIMTSEGNHEATVAYFGQNGFFGYEPIAFFKQGRLPMLGFDGRVLLAERHRLREGPDGNGTIFKNLVASGMLGDMRRRGVKWFFVCNVDNIMAQCADPEFLGLLIMSGLRCGSISVLKNGPGERVGVFCRKAGRPAVVEYSELPGELANRTGGDGALLYGDGHISCSLFHADVPAMKEIGSMPYHAARKKSAYIGADGGEVEPPAENALKFESFIFDVFPFFDEMLILRTGREEAFAPVKNSAGEDSPETARQIYMKSHVSLMNL